MQVRMMKKDANDSLDLEAKHNKKRASVLSFFVGRSTQWIMESFLSNNHIVIRRMKRRKEEAYVKYWKNI